MQVPGFLWTAILALIPLLIEWLQGDYFSGQAWVSIVIIILGAVAKLLEVYRVQSGAQARGLYSEPQPSAARRFLLGG